MTTVVDTEALVLFRGEVEALPELAAWVRGELGGVEVVDGGEGLDGLDDEAGARRLRVGGSLSFFTARLLQQVLALATSDPAVDRLEIALDDVDFVGHRSCEAMVAGTRAFRGRGGVLTVWADRAIVRSVLRRHLAGRDGIVLS